MIKDFTLILTFLFINLNEVFVINNYTEGFIGSYHCKKSCQINDIYQSTINENIDFISVELSKFQDTIVQIKVGNNLFYALLLNGQLLPYKPRYNIKGKIFENDSISFSLHERESNTVCNYQGKKLK